ncbi:MAG TPA: NAD(P)-binding domain-containing protein [Jiangellaceae bacterium]|nr:NAD(P)-binding domain-containing protein [Jiangellaceae bacterium]
MKAIDTVVIGAGHAGLATSRCLTDAGREHIVLDRGRLAESWRSARWDSLHLLTPNWMSRLPGWSYRGDDPDGYMPAADLVGYLAAYARSFGAPVRSWTAVTDVRPGPGGYQVTTADGAWSARNVVVAAGPRPRVPALSTALAPGIAQVHTNRYRKPSALPDGGVLVVGASASGVQVASELRQVGREVVLAVGTHTRLPRRYRGMDIMWWLEQLGALDRTVDEVSDLNRARRDPSSQLTGSYGGRGLDLATLNDLGVVITGRLTGADGYQVSFAPDLPSTTAAADERLRRTLAKIDSHVATAGLDTEVCPPEDIPAVRLPAGPASLDLRAAGISTVVWATGFEFRYPWLRVPVTDAYGEIKQYRGVTDAPGLYVMGLRFMHRRNSQFLDGARHDANAVVHHLTGAAALATRE